MSHVVITFLVLAFVIVAIISKKIPVIAVGLLIPFFLVVSGVVPAASAFSNLGSKINFLIIGALALGDACFQTGLTEQIGTYVIRYTQRFTNESVKLFLISMLAAVMSSFLSSFGVQVALLSLIIVMSQMLRISKTRAMLALGYGATIGGTWTIIGTPIMFMAKSTYEATVSDGTIGMFEIGLVSIPVGILVLLVFSFLTSRYLPDRCADQVLSGQRTQPQTQNAAATPRNRKIVAVTFVMFVILVALDGQIPLAANMVSVLVLLILGATGVSSTKQMINCINWDVLLFISGITLLSDTMTSSGVSGMIGDFLISTVGRTNNPYIIVGIVCLISSILTQLMSNSGAFGIMLPLLPVISSSLGVNLKPLLVAAAISCTAGFCLPISAPSYIMLASEGNIQTGDWIQQGVPALLITLMLSVILIPALFPLF